MKGCRISHYVNLTFSETKVQVYFYDLVTKLENGWYQLHSNVKTPCTC